MTRLYTDSAKGYLPVPPAQLALVTILQAYTGVSDDEAIEALTMNRRWQLVLDCLDCETAPLSKATMVRFRARLIEKRFDRRLIERTVGMAERDGGFGPRHSAWRLIPAPCGAPGGSKTRITSWDSSAEGRKALGVIARQQGRGLTDLATEVGAPFLGGTSVKAALDLDWDTPTERERSLRLLLDALVAIERWQVAHP